MKKTIIFLVALRLLSVAAVTSAAALAAEALHTVTDEANVGKSGRAWMVRPPGSGDGSMRQLDAVSPAIVGDGKEDQGWGYMLAFQPEAAFVEASRQTDVKLTLTVASAKAIGGGPHAPVKLYLLSARKAPGKFSQFGAYNVAEHKAVHEQTIEGDAAGKTFTFDVGPMLTGAGGIEAGKVIYFLLACDPHTDADGAGEHLEFVSEGSGQPTLSIQSPTP